MRKEFMERTGLPRSMADVRTTYDEQGNDYTWIAYEGMHASVEPYINKRFNTRTHQQWEWWKRADKDEYPTDYSYIRYSLTDTDDADMDAEIDRMIAKWGKLPQGEKAINTSPIPAQTSPELNVRRFARTASESGIFSPEEQGRVQGAVGGWPILLRAYQRCAGHKQRGRSHGTGRRRRLAAGMGRRAGLEQDAR